jgi:polyketide synthase 12/epothilone polyketide synthase D
MWAAPGTPSADLLSRTEYTQPAIFAFEYALLCLWRSRGVAPDVVIGHSIGEFAAACAAGVMDPADAMDLVVARGQGMAGLPAGGAMVSVTAGEDEVAAMIRGLAGTAIAAVNGPCLVVVAGPEASVARLEQLASAAHLPTSRLAVSHAFHSPLMAPMVDEFGRHAARIRYRPPQVPLLSTVTGSPAGDEIARADYWTQHILARVRFHQAMAALPEDVDALLDLGPQPTLIAMAARSRVAGERRLLACAGRAREDQTVLEAVAALYQGGLDLDPARWFDGDRRRIALPGYPWQRQRYWIDESAPAPAEATPVAPPIVVVSHEADAESALDIVHRQLDVMSQQLQLLGGALDAGTQSVPEPQFQPNSRIPEGFH